MKTHKELFQALLDGEELKSVFNNKTMRLDSDGNVVLVSKNWHNFNPQEWMINKPEVLSGETENKT